MAASVSAGRPRGLLLDVDGVLVESWEALPGAIETIEWLRREEIPFLLATNTTIASRATLAGMLRDAGFAVEPDEIVTAPVITAAYLARHHPGARCFLLAKGDAIDDMEGVETTESDADVVVVAGAEDGFSYDNMNRAYRMLLEGASLVAMHRNVSWMTSEGLKLDAGPYVTALEEAANVKATVVGKPAADFFTQAVDLLGTPPAETLMVGDDVLSDVLAAQDAGLTGVLVRTGKFSEESLSRAPRQPNHVIDAVTGVRDLLVDE